MIPILCLIVKTIVRPVATSRSWTHLKVLFHLLQTSDTMLAMGPFQDTVSTQIEAIITAEVPIHLLVLRTPVVETRHQ